MSEGNKDSPEGALRGKNFPRNPPANPHKTPLREYLYHAYRGRFYQNFGEISPVVRLRVGTLVRLGNLWKFAPSAFAIGGLGDFCAIVKWGPNVDFFP